MAKSKTPRNQMLAAGAKETYPLLAGRQNGTDSSEGSLAASYKAKYIHTLGASDLTHWELSEGDKNLGLYKNHT